MYKISVIIPVFNAENTLNRAIDSILNQKWEGDVIEDIEIILVDDCSTDNSKNILNQYSDNYSNVKVLSTENNTGSPSIPRNIGIKNSNGNYLMFMDNDDEFCDDICQTLFETITNENVDVVTCNYYNIVKSNVKEVNLNLNVDNIISKGNLLFFDSFNAFVSNEFAIWNKIYDKKIIIENNITFPPRIAEDTFFCTNVFLKMDKMAYLKDYYGIKRHFQSDSLSSTITSSHILNTLDSLIDLSDIFDLGINFDKNPQYKFIYPRYIIPGDLIKIMFLRDTQDIKICLNKMYEYENKISFDNSLQINTFYDASLKILNYFILNKHFTIATWFIKLSHIGIGIIKLLKK